jgi:hypothetical protein
MTPRKAVVLHRLDDLGSYANGSEEKSGWSLCRMAVSWPTGVRALARS